MPFYQVRGPDSGRKTAAVSKDPIVRVPIRRNTRKENEAIKEGKSPVWNWSEARRFWMNPTPAGMFMRTARTVRRSTKPRISSGKSQKKTVFPSLKLDKTITKTYFMVTKNRILRFLSVNNRALSQKNR